VRGGFARINRSTPPDTATRSNAARHSRVNAAPYRYKTSRANVNTGFNSADCH